MGTIARSTAALCLSASLLACGFARAQDTPAAGNAAAAPAASGAESSGVAAPGGGGSAAALAKKQGATASPVGTPGTLQIANGVALTATYLGEAAGNPTGGIRQGSAYAAQIFGGLDFDLKTIAGLDGGTVHFSMVQRHGNSLSIGSIGNDTSVQQIYGMQKLRLTIFTYEQMLADGRIDLEVGRSGGNNAFLNSPLYCQFQSNVICGSPVYIFQVSNFTAFPASGWMGRSKIFLTDKIFFHSGIYAADPRNTDPQQVGFDWSTRTATGVTIPTELGYATDFTNDRLPRHYGVGVILDASKHADPFYDANFEPAILTGAGYRMDGARSDAYARFDQMVWRPNDESPRGLSVFGVALQHTSGRAEQEHSLELGVLQLGTLPGRDRDTIGFMVNEKRFSPLFVNNILAAHAVVGSTATVPREEIMFELNYGLEVNKAVRLLPNLQYVLNPDQSAEPFRSQRIRNAFVIGGQFVIDLTALH